LEKVQRRFTRILTELRGKDYHDRLRNLNLWMLEVRRNRQDYHYTIIISSNVFVKVTQ